MSNEEDQLIKQLSHFSIGTQDDSLSRQLGNTRLADPPVVSQSTNNQQQHTTQWPSSFTAHTTTQLPSWQTNLSTVASFKDDEEGWGDAPAYTSILQNTYFGFSSTMLPSHSSLPLSSSDNTTQGTVSLDPNQPFSRFSHQPVSFTSLTSPPTHDIFE